jgi:hypothetical protein
MVLKDGFIIQDGQIGTTSTLWIDADGVTFEHPGNNAYYSRVEWSSENRMGRHVLTRSAYCNGPAVSGFR